ncbi:MAG TPA: PKD domain-containing protein, partial [Chitinophagales bacterium]|nr:PKD domain-containing protein [Chitinophagales bacterium]
NAYPTSTFTVTSPVCANQNSAITYTGTASAGATYSWDFGGGTPATGNAQGPYNVSWATAGTQNVTLNVTENGCAAMPTTIPVTVNPYPTATFTTVSPVCTGQNSAITYTGTGTGAATYTWDFSGGSPATGNTQGPFNVTWATAGSKTITLTVAENGCTSPPNTATVVVNAIPTSAFTVVSPVCTGQNSTITYTGTGSAGATYAWDFSGGTPSTGNTQGPFNVSWATAGTQNITLNVTENGCTGAPTTIPVTVNAIPVSDAGTDVQFCSGDSMQIGTASVPGYTYAWSPVAGLSSNAVANPYADATNVTNGPVTTLYTVTTSQNNCSSTATVNVTVNPMPVASFTPPAGQCLSGNSFSFINTGTFTSSATFAWNFGVNGIPTTSTTQNQQVSFSAPGTQNVSLIISQYGCISNTATGTADVYPMPSASFATDTFIGCENFKVCFVNNSVANAPATYAWSFGDGGSSNVQAPCNTYVAPGTYTVSLHVTSADGCQNDTNATDYITVIADPHASFTTSDFVIILPEQNTITLTNTSTNAVSYLWTLGKLGNSTDFEPPLVFTDSGNYNLVLRSYNSIGCVDSTEHLVRVLPPDNFFIPNVFTPNGDGNNDNFYPFTQPGAELRVFKIFDRWGELVHSGLYPWDGTFKGKPCPPAVYVYYAEFGLDEQTYIVKRKGTVTLIR